MAAGVEDSQWASGSLRLQYCWIIIPGSFVSSCQDRWPTRSARIRVEQATPVIHSYLMTGFRLWFLVGSLLSSLSHLASHLELNPLWLFILEDKGYVANLYQNKSDGLWGESVEGSGRKQLSSEVNDGQKKNNHILFMVIKCLALAS